MKASFLSVKYDTNWILKNMEAGKSVAVEQTLEVLNQLFDGKTVVLNREFHLCRVVAVHSGDVDCDKLVELLKLRISGFDLSMVKIEVDPAEAGELKDALILVKDKLDKDLAELFEKEFAVVFSKDDTSKSGRTPKMKVAEKDIWMSDLIGMENLKGWMEEISVIGERFKKLAVDTKVINSTAYLFSINRGNGLTTILQLMADTFKKSGLVEFEGKTDFVEWKFQYRDDPNDYSSLGELVELIEKVSVGRCFRGLVAVDVETWLDKLSDRRFDALLDIVWRFREEIIFVFTMPFAEDSVVEKMRARIDDVIAVRTMKFVPPSDVQYFQYFKKFFAKYSISVSDSVENSFVTKITMEKNDGRFYGFNTVRKIANEILYHVILNAAKDDADIISEVKTEDFEKMYGVEPETQISGMEQLNGMVALVEVKNKVHEILSSVKLQKELYAQNGAGIRPCFHMMFAGNPGTGKTVVARLLGRIFKEEGLLPIGNFYEVTRKDLVGRFVGHTAPKTMEVCRNAYGSVLFIDEAYMLAEERDTYSAEAIGTLIAEMENNRDKMVVIFAGYEKELEGLFELNPGLRDRIPHKIVFPNYSRDELKQIFYLQLKNKVDFDQSFKETADKFFDEFPEDILGMKDFSNGRFIRNLAERIMSKAALRFEMSDEAVSEFCLSANDFTVAVADRDFQKMFVKEKRISRIGF